MHLITFEGIDGAGKTTQINLFARHMEEQGYDVLVLREPGGTDMGEEIRDVLKKVRTPDQQLTPMAQLFAFNAARAQLVDRVIRPALEEGKIVICDRFIDSTMCYQGFAGGLDENLVQQVCDIATSNTHEEPLPYTTVYLKISPEVSAARREARGEVKDGIESTIDFARVAEGFDALAEKNSDTFWVIDADRPIEQVHAEIISKISDLTTP